MNIEDARKRFEDICSIPSNFDLEECLEDVRKAIDRAKRNASYIPSKRLTHAGKLEAIETLKAMGYIAEESFGGSIWITGWAESEAE